MTRITLDTLPFSSDHHSASPQSSLAIMSLCCHSGAFALYFPNIIIHIGVMRCSGRLKQITWPPKPRPSCNTSHRVPEADITAFSGLPDGVVVWLGRFIQQCTKSEGRTKARAALIPHIIGQPSSKHAECKISGGRGYAWVSRPGLVRKRSSRRATVSGGCSRQAGPSFR